MWKHFLTVYLRIYQWSHVLCYVVTHLALAVATYATLCTSHMNQRRPDAKVNFSSWKKKKMQPELTPTMCTWSIHCCNYSVMYRCMLFLSCWQPTNCYSRRTSPIATWLRRWDNGMHRSARWRSVSPRLKTMSGTEHTVTESRTCRYVQEGTELNWQSTYFLIEAN